MRYTSCTIVAAWLLLPGIGRADIIEFAHRDVTTSYHGIGGATGHVLTVRMDNAGAGTAGQTWGSPDFLSATFKSGSYIAEYGFLFDALSFSTDGSGLLTSSSVGGFSAFSASDSLGGPATPSIGNLTGSDYLLLNSLSDGVFVTHSSWRVPLNNTGWSAAAAAVPEPSSYILLVAGLVGAVGYHRRQTSPG